MLIKITVLRFLRPVFVAHLGPARGIGLISSGKKEIGLEEPTCDSLGFATGELRLSVGVFSTDWRVKGAADLVDRSLGGISLLNYKGWSVTDDSAKLASGLMMEPEGKHRNSIMKHRILAVFGLVEIVLRYTLTMNDFQGLMMQLEGLSRQSDHYYRAGGAGRGRAPRRRRRSKRPHKLRRIKTRPATAALCQKRVRSPAKSDRSGGRRPRGPPDNQTPARRRPAGGVSAAPPVLRDLLPGPERPIMFYFLFN
ncbi:hypothetical protein EVAR_23893_1 [Eumeta japonica]|uniref:Uncharacterized protein n=1 Tax=Eumeta variegata TaxID=151549 RepID=A0A4C1V4Q3_EUMVA|nr:hypothetical protein EVAR_23893_1 [Eumeta japonica]